MWALGTSPKPRPPARPKGESGPCRSAATGFGLVVDRHVAVVLRVAGGAVAFGIDALHRAAVGPAHVQRTLPDRDEVAVIRLAGDLDRGLGPCCAVLGPGGGLRQDAHGTHQAFLRLLDEVRRGQVEAAELDGRGVDVVHRAAQLRHRLAFTLQVAGIVLVGTGRPGATGAGTRGHGLHWLRPTLAPSDLVMS